MTEIELLAEQLNVNERTLRRAVNHGVLRARRPSPRRLEIPLAEKRYARHAWPLLAALRAALRTEGNIRFALLFGSAARGDDTRRSDVDLLVEMRDDSLDRVADLSTKLETLTGRRMDVLPLGSAETVPELLASAIAEGRVLVDRGGHWPRLQERESSLRRRARGSEKRRRDTALAGIDHMLAT
ncbi:MAG: nucleotidyltransferase domain-containing protein [Solirubrobacterales bacterium]